VYQWDRRNADNHAIAPGFVLTCQNKSLVIDEAIGEMTDRAKAVIIDVPMARFGDSEEIVGAGFGVN
jgi:NAD(P)-dependent dehydrogenase (short-subunit alcohol dehydrogenase family)